MSAAAVSASVATITAINNAVVASDDCVEMYTAEGFDALWRNRERQAVHYAPQGARVIEQFKAAGWVPLKMDPSWLDRFRSECATKGVYVAACNLRKQGASLDYVLQILSLVRGAKTSVTSAPNGA